MVAFHCSLSAGHLKFRQQQRVIIIIIIIIIITITIIRTIIKTISLYSE